MPFRNPIVRIEYALSTPCGINGNTTYYNVRNIPLSYPFIENNKCNCTHPNNGSKTMCSQTMPGFYSSGFTKPEMEVYRDNELLPRINVSLSD